MNKYVNGNNSSCMIGYNPDTNEITVLDSFYFDYIWIVPEDGEHSITKKDGTTEKDHIAKMQDEKQKISSTFPKCECVSSVSSN